MYGVSIAVARGNKTANIATGNMKYFIFALKKNANGIKTAVLFSLWNWHMMARI